MTAAVADLRVFADLQRRRKAQYLEWLDAGGNTRMDVLFLALRCKFERPKLLATYRALTQEAHIMANIVNPNLCHWNKKGKQMSFSAEHICGKAAEFSVGVGDGFPVCAECRKHPGLKNARYGPLGGPSRERLSDEQRRAAEQKQAEVAQ